MRAHPEVSTPARSKVIPQVLILFAVGTLLGWVWNPSSLHRRELKQIEKTAPRTLPEIEITDARRLWEQGGLVIIDSRDRASFEKGHAAGAVAAFDHRGRSTLKAIRRWTPIEAEVLVMGDASSPYQPAIYSGRLLRAGFGRVRVLVGGIQAWKKAGLPVTVGWDMAPLLKTEDDS